MMHVALRGLRSLVMALAVAAMWPLGPSPARAQTGLTLPFDGSLVGTRGQNPLTARGVAFDAGKVGQGALIESGDLLQYASATNLDPQEGTLELWYRPNWNPGEGPGYMLCLYNGGGGMMFAVDGGPNLRGIFNCWSSEQVQVITSAAGWRAGEWHHIAFTWSSSALLLRLYVDGALKDEWHLSAPLRSETDPVINVGSQDGGWTAGGVMDEFSISTRAKSAGEILNSYLSTVGLTALAFRPENLTLWKTWWRKPRLFAETPAGSVELPHDAYPLTSTNPAVASIRADNYIVAADAGTCDITTTFGGLNATMHVTVRTPVLPERDETIDPVLSTPMPGHIWEMPVVIVRFIPTADGTMVDKACIGPDGSWVTVEMARGWIDKFEKRVKNGLELRSRFRAHSRPEARPSLGYRVLKIITFYEPMPPYMDFQPDEAWHQPDYDQILRRINAQHWVTEHNVKEFWVWGYHEGGIYPVESNMSSPTTGDISNSYRLNDLPVFDRTYTLYGYNFMRTQTEALHNHGHQIEAILTEVAWRQDGHGLLFWENFAGVIPGVGMGTGRCGTCHCPPNTNLDYDYLNETPVLSDCEDWTPDYTGEKKMVNMHRWRDLVFEWPGDPGFNDPALWSTRAETQYLIYWWQNMPGWDNGIRYGASEEMTNWWKFTGDWDGSIARMAAEGGLHGPKQPKMTSMVADAATGAPGMNISLRAVLTQRSNGAGVEGKSVTFTVDGTAVGTDETSSTGEGTVAYVVGDLGAGDHELRAVFAGDADFAAAADAATLTVTGNRAATKTNTLDRTGVGASAVLLRGYLYRKSDSVGLSGRTLAFSIAGTQVGTGTTSSSGSASLSWVIGPGAATRQIRVDFAGDASFEPSFGTATLTVLTYDTTLMVPNRAGEIGDAVSLRAYLYRSPQALAVSGKTVGFVVDGTSVGSAATNTSGRALLSWVVPDTLAPGAHALVADWPGDAGYRPSSGAAILTVDRGVTYVWVMSRSMARGTSAYLRTLVRRMPDLVPLANKTIRFSVDGTELGFAVTGADGRAAYLYAAPTGMTAGDHQQMAEFAGDTHYLPGAGTAMLTITP